MACRSLVDRIGKKVFRWYLFHDRKALGCIQEQSGISGYEVRGGYRFGMDIGVSIWACGDMIPSQHVDKQVG